MTNFTIYPAIDLRGGQVVRLKQGDPSRQTTYGNDPGEAAQRWFEAGSEWIHVVNLDGAFGDGDAANLIALAAITKVAAEYDGKIQFGGGMRELADIERVVSLGVNRAILGTAAIESPALVTEAVAKFASADIAVGIDARDGQVKTRGWVKETQWDPVSLGNQLKSQGVKTLIYTNIARDGVGTGVDVPSTADLAAQTGLHVIASGGVATLEHVQAVKDAGLPGVIIGRALYEGEIDLKDALNVS